MLCRGEASALDPVHSPGLPPPPAALRHPPWPRGLLLYKPARSGLSVSRMPDFPAQLLAISGSGAFCLQGASVFRQACAPWET